MPDFFITYSTVVLYHFVPSSILIFYFFLSLFNNIVSFFLSFFYFYTFQKSGMDSKREPMMEEDDEPPPPGGAGGQEQGGPPGPSPLENLEQQLIANEELPIGRRGTTSSKRGRGTNSPWLQQPTGTSSLWFWIQHGAPHNKIQQTRTPIGTGGGF